MKNDFLSEFAARILRDYKDSLGDLKIIFPNRRAGLFFSRALANYIEKPVWSPQISSIEDFILDLSDLIRGDPLNLLMDLYEIFTEHFSTKESFDNYYFWGNMLLRDFDEIDKYLINPDDIFITLKNLKEIDARFNFFSDEHREALKSFWASTWDHPSEQKNQFLNFWKTLNPVYHKYHKKLREKGYAYAGQIYRDVCDRISKGKLQNPGQQIIFSGLNALNPAEEKIIKWFVENSGAKVFWDIDKYYFDDPVHEAGLFFRKYYNDPVFRISFKNSIPDNFRKQDKQIQTIAVSQYSGQTAIAGTILNKLISEDPALPLDRSVIVLTDESLLSMLLHTIPDEIPAVNITMGYPIRNSAFFSLFDNILEMQSSIRDGKGKCWFYYRNVINILNHPFITGILHGRAEVLAGIIQERNMIYIPEDMLNEEENLKKIFSKSENTDGLFEYLSFILIYIRHSLAIHDQGEFLFENEFSNVFYRLLNNFRETLKDRQIKASPDLIRKIFKYYAHSETIPFTGEPLKGLQIMGLLETRNLDFDNVILLCANEDSLPLSGSQNSFIPYNVRKAFGLSLPENRDAIYSYLFYRLIQRAKKVFLIYHTENSSNRNSEPSRYINQLKIESGHKVISVVQSDNVVIKPRKPVIIGKDPFIIKRLERYVVSGKTTPKQLTPSSLNLYLACPLNFCYRYIYDLHEQEEITEDLDAAKFGIILHKTMESIYRPFENIRLQEKDIENIERSLVEAVHRAFSQYHGVSDPENFIFEGKNILGREIIHRVARKILDKDKEKVPFTITGLERHYACHFPLELNGKKLQIALKGIIDRVDLKDDTFSIIDYKSGGDLANFDSLESLFDPANKKRNKAVFQIFLYALLFIRNHPEHKGPVNSCLYNFRELYNSDFNPLIKFKTPGSGPDNPITDIRPYLLEFNDKLQQLFGELFNADIPFKHWEGQEKCIYCDSLGIPTGFE